MIHVPVFRKKNKHRILDVLTIGSLLAAWIYALVNLTRLPTTIPIHYGFDGIPNGWGSKYMILFLPALFTLIVLFIQWIAGKPQWHNYPSSYYSERTTDDKRAVMQEMSAALLIILRTTISVIAAFLTWEMVKGSQSNSLPYHGWEMPVILGAVIIPIVYHLIRYNRLLKS